MDIFAACKRMNCKKDIRCEGVREKIYRVDQEKRGMMREKRKIGVR